MTFPSLCAIKKLKCTVSDSKTENIYMIKNYSLSIMLTATHSKTAKIIKSDITQHHVDIGDVWWVMSPFIMFQFLRCGFNTVNKLCRLIKSLN